MELEFNNEVVFDTANFKIVPIVVLSVLGETDIGREGRREGGRTVYFRNCAVWLLVSWWSMCPFILILVQQPTVIA